MCYFLLHPSFFSFLFSLLFMAKLCCWFKKKILTELAWLKWKRSGWKRTFARPSVGKSSPSSWLFLASTRPSVCGSNFAVDEATQLNSAEATPGRVIPADLAGNAVGMGICSPGSWESLTGGSTFPARLISVFQRRNGSGRWVPVNNL